MRRPVRSRRKPFALLLDTLENRQLLTGGGMVSVQANPHDITEPWNVPSTPIIPAVFSINNTGTDQVTVNYTLNIEPAGSIQYIEWGYNPATGNYLEQQQVNGTSYSGIDNQVFAQGDMIAVFPVPGNTGVDDKLTLALTNASSCAGTYTIGSPSADTVTIHSTANPNAA